MMYNKLMVGRNQSGTIIRFCLKKQSCEYYELSGQVT